MGEIERADERAAVAQDRKTLKQAKRRAQRHKNDDAGAKQIAERLDDMTGAADLNDPQRYHGT
jgi:hypothetical protein